MKYTLRPIPHTGTPWITQDPFIFSVYHLDHYPKGNGSAGPVSSLEGRNPGNDFTLKDGWRMYHGTKVPGFPVHPHRGFETITFVLNGMVDHADSKGAAGRYGNRDVQWMTAGSGLQHAEMFPLLKEEEENPLELFQIWLNLPASRKFVKPYYKMLWGESIPLLKLEDENNRRVEVDMVAGKWGDVVAPSPAPDSWAADSENEVAIWQISMDEEAHWKIPAVTPGVLRTLYFFEGDSIHLNGETVSSRNAVLVESGEEILIQNGSKNSRLLLLQGKPISEPVVQYGPFVMNTQQEIQEAFSDYRKTQFGGWPWPDNGQVHDLHKGRFAKYEDGTLIEK